MDVGIWLRVTIYQHPNHPVHVLALTTCSGRLAAGTNTIREGMNFIQPSCMGSVFLNVLSNVFLVWCCKRGTSNSGENASKSRMVGCQHHRRGPGACME